MEESVISGKNIEVLVRVRPLVDREGGTEDVTVIREGKVRRELNDDITLTLFAIDFRISTHQAQYIKHKNLYSGSH
jgi:hypothetical protein